MDEKVQLSRETVVGDQVSTTDIYPNTNTRSVNDEQAGTSLSETIERLWAAINNKLARVVNSVNGRTGVVVLDASDVGLENVDNVSFNDIKQWVIDEMNNQFGYKQLKIYPSSSELLQAVSENNMDNLYSPFYVEKWNDGSDTRPYIGCFVLSPTNVLTTIHTPINAIGCTDESIKYKKTIESGVMEGMKAGEIAVNISSDETSLYVERGHSGADLDKNGLRIDQNEIGGKLHFYDGAYGTAANSYSDGLVTPVDRGDATPPCTIKIDGKSLGDNFHLNDTSIHLNDIIVCNFDDYRSASNDDIVTLDASKIYIDTSDDYANCGDGYRVGDIITIEDFKTTYGITVKFEVTKLKDGVYCGPVKSLNLLYCEKFDRSNSSVPTGTFNTEDIVRFYQPEDQNKYSEPVPVSDYDGMNVKIKVKDASYAHGLKIIITEDCWIKDQYQLPDGFDFSLMMRGMCIGKVTHAPSERLGRQEHHVIEFNSIRPLLGTSMKYGVYDALHEDTYSKCIDVQTRKGHVNQFGLWKEMLDVSGLTVVEDWGTYRYDGQSAKLIDDSPGNTIVEPSRFKRTAVLPIGAVDIMSNAQMSKGGLTIMTDMSLCIMPHEICGPSHGESGNDSDIRTSLLADNWAAQTPYIFPRYEKELPSYVGINLFKAVSNKDSRTGNDVDKYMSKYHLYNLSGLRIIDKWEKLSKSLVGKTTDSYLNNNGGATMDSYLESLPLSGGLMVNVGNALEIRGYDSTGADSDYYEGGKVCVRVDDDTVFVNDDNRLEVKVGTGLFKEHDPDDIYRRRLAVNIDKSTIQEVDSKLVALPNDVVYYDIDIFSNYHAVKNLLQNTTVNGTKVPLSVYVDTKYGLGFTMGSTAPYALKIKIKADDVGGTRTVYRSIYTGLDDDALVFDPNGILRCPIDESKGLRNTYTAKAISADTNGNVNVSETGGLAIKIGAGLTFDDEGALALSSNSDLKSLSQGYDLNNLTPGNYCADTDAIANSIVNIPISSIGMFRIEHIKMCKDRYMQKLYAYSHPGVVYMRYYTADTSVATRWGKWYTFTGTIID